MAEDDSGWPTSAPPAVAGLQLLREGRYAAVYAAHCPAFGGAVAVKVYPSGGSAALSARRRRLAMREAGVLKFLNAAHVPHVPRLHGAYVTRNGIHLVGQLFEGGDLLAALQRRKGRGFPEAAVAAQFALPLLRALAAMHAAGVVHRDVKLENVFLDAQGRPYLGDFDLAVFSHDPPARAPVGTAYYMAPEMLLLASVKGTPLEPAAAARLGPPLDVWSLGVCLFELVAGYKPFQGASFEGVAGAVLNARREPLPPGAAGPALEDFLDRCLAHDSAARPSAADLLSHPWVAARAPAAGDASAGEGSVGAGGGAAQAGCWLSAGGGDGGGAGGVAGLRSDSAGSIEEMQHGQRQREREAKAALAAYVAAAAGAAGGAGAAARQDHKQPPATQQQQLAAARAAAAAAAAMACRSPSCSRVGLGTLVGDTHEYDSCSGSSCCGGDGSSSSGGCSGGDGGPAGWRGGGRRLHALLAGGGGSAGLALLPSGGASPSGPPDAALGLLATVSAPLRLFRSSPGCAKPAQQRQPQLQQPLARWSDQPQQRPQAHPARAPRHQQPEQQAPQSPAPCQQEQACARASDCTQPRPLRRAASPFACPEVQRRVHSLLLLQPVAGAPQPAPQAEPAGPAAPAPPPQADGPPGPAPALRGVTSTLPLPPPPRRRSRLSGAGAEAAAQQQPAARARRPLLRRLFACVAPALASVA